jgi:formamidopyrimidine-DNA glycosylase
MPELPEVETIVRTLAQEVTGCQVSSYSLLFPGVIRNESKEVLDKLFGKIIISVGRRGKLILLNFQGNLKLICHLKMTGQFILCHPRESLDKHTHFTLTFSNCTRELRFRDVRKFGYIFFLTNSDSSHYLELGPEPLTLDFQNFKRLFNGRSARLKGLLLNQSFIAGIGNIYADEILFAARLNPMIPSSFLEESEIRRLYSAMKRVLKRAIEEGGSSISTYRNADGKQGNYQKFHKVYGRESLPCYRCGKAVARVRLGSRSCYFCPRCQEEIGGAK